MDFRFASLERDTLAFRLSIDEQSLFDIFS